MSEQSDRFQNQDQINEALIGVPGFFDDIRKRVEARELAKASRPTPETTRSLGQKVLGLNRVFRRPGHSHQAQPPEPENSPDNNQ